MKKSWITYRVELIKEVDNLNLVFCFNLIFYNKNLKAILMKIDHLTNLRITAKN